LDEQEIEAQPTAGISAPTSVLQPPASADTAERSVFAVGDGLLVYCTRNNTRKTRGNLQREAVFVLETHLLRRFSAVEYSLFT